jgi:hypothetical protein
VKENGQNGGKDLANMNNKGSNDSGKNQIENRHKSKNCDHK